MKLEWSAAAIVDLQRFADFLNERDPELAGRIARAIIEKCVVLESHPRLGQPISGHEEFRQLVLKVRGGAYVFQYRYDGKRLVMLRVFHGSERRE